MNSAWPEDVTLHQQPTVAETVQLSKTTQSGHYEMFYTLHSVHGVSGEQALPHGST